MQDPTKQVLTLSMAESGVTDWFPLLMLHSSIDCAWPATGTPIGTLSIELTSDPTDATRVVVVDTGNFVPAPTQPSGTADRTVFDDLRTCESHGRVRYTKTSGGTGATLTVTVNGKSA